MITSLNFRAMGRLSTNTSYTKYNTMYESVKFFRKQTKYNVLSYYLYRRNVETFQTLCINIQFKEPSVSKIVLVISTYIGCLPKLSPNVYALICFPVVLPLCYHYGIKILIEKELGILSLCKEKSIFHYV